MKEILLDFEVTLHKYIDNDYKETIADYIGKIDNSVNRGQFYDAEHKFNCYDEKPSHTNNSANDRWRYEKWASFADKPDHFVIIARMVRTHLCDEIWTYELLLEAEKCCEDLAP
jgi:hypothetical protein